jgi:uncharacterized Fe-S cluster-containing radical SAM superfamily protein
MKFSKTNCTVCVCVCVRHMPTRGSCSVYHAERCARRRFFADFTTARAVYCSRSCSYSRLHFHEIKFTTLWEFYQWSSLVQVHGNPAKDQVEFFAVRGQTPSILVTTEVECVTWHQSKPLRKLKSPGLK